MTLSMGLRCVFAVLLFAPLPCRGLDEPWFKAEKGEIPFGGATTLSWQWNGAIRAYLSSHGPIGNPARGTLNVSPMETTTYVLILEAPGLPSKVLTQRIIVATGAKGSGVWPHDDIHLPLAHSSEFDLRSGSMARAASKVRRVLQDDRKFEIRQVSPGDGQMVFATAYLQDPMLVEPNETPRRIRRIALRVFLRVEATNVIRLRISSIIQWRSSIDSRWFPESSSSTDRYHKYTASLHGALQAD